MPLDNYIMNVARDCADKVMALLPADEPERTGGCLVLRIERDEDNPGFELEGRNIGTFSTENQLLYEFHAAEKAARLASQPHNRSSWQSRDEKNGKWGGAIRLLNSDVVLSFSGFPWEADEALVLMIAVVTHSLTALHAVEIAQISSNSFYLEKVLTAHSEFKPADDA